MEKISTEILVIGAGPGGYAAAFLAADKGKQVILVDSASTLGGVCLKEGCIPSKALLHAAKILNDMNEASAIGITFDNVHVDIDVLRSWKDNVINKLVHGLGQLSQRRKIQFISGRASFIDSFNVKIEKEDNPTLEISFKKAIIATGTVPLSLPVIPGHKKVMNSSQALALEDKPKSLLIIGAGYIGLELGTVYAALGTEVTIADKLPELLIGIDRDLVRVLEKRFKTTFKNILLHIDLKKIEETPRGFKVTMEDKDGKAIIEEYEKILVSIGRKPHTANLGLRNTSVKTDDKGYICVNDQRQTADPNIYAIGDITGQPLLAHKASHEGKVAVGSICGGNIGYNGDLIPYVIFTDPEIACVGLTETKAKQTDIPVEISKFPWVASGKALTQNRSDGLTKLIVDPQTKRILGVSLVGVGAGELIMEGALAIKMNATVNDLKNLIHPHPTLAESIMESAEVYLGTCTNLFKQKK